MHNHYAKGVMVGSTANTQTKSCQHTGTYQVGVAAERRWFYSGRLGEGRRSRRGARSRSYHHCRRVGVRDADPGD